MLIKLGFLVLLFYTVQIIAESKFCFSRKKNSFSNFKPVSNYDKVLRSKIGTPKNCTPIYLWSLMKTWESSVEYFDFKCSLAFTQLEISKNHAENRGELCDTDLANLRNWIFDGSIDYIFREKLANELVEEKWEEALKNTIKNNKDQDFLKQSSTGQQLFEIKSVDSRKFTSPVTSLARLLYAKKYLKDDDKYYGKNSSQYQEDELNCQKYCHKYLNNSSLTEKTNSLFEHVLKDTVQEISTRLGYKENDLSFANITLMYLSCAYDNQVETEMQPFCAAFLPEQLKLLEYIFDFIAYHLREKPSHSLVIPTMLYKFNAAVQNTNNSNAIKANFFTTDITYFTDTITELGLHHDSFSDTFDEDVLLEHELNATFSYPSCPEDNLDQKVAFFHNEKPISVYGCEENLCSLNFLKKKFSGLLLNYKESQDVRNPHILPLKLQKFEDRKYNERKVCTGACCYIPNNK